MGMRCAFIQQDKLEKNILVVNYRNQFLAVRRTVDRKLMLLCMLFLMSACVREPDIESYFHPGQTQTELKEQAVFQVSLVPEELNRFSSPEKAFWTKASDECLRICARKIMNTEPLVQAQRRGPERMEKVFWDGQGTIIPQASALTEEKFHEFSCTIKVLPEWDMSGKVLPLEQEMTVAAAGDFLNLYLFGNYLKKPPAYFFLGRKTHKQDFNLIRIFGSGKILQVLGKETQLAGEGEETGVLAKGRIMETRHEVIPGDLIFLAHMKLAAEKEEEKNSVQSFQEAQVQPVIRLTPENSGSNRVSQQEPLETK